MKKFGLAVVAAAAIGLFAGNAMAGGLPSSKVAFAYGDLYSVSTSACATEGPNSGACLGGGTSTDTGWHDVMASYIKTPNGKELAMDVAMQCALVNFTEAAVKTNGGGKASGKAASEGRLVVRVKVDDANSDGSVIPSSTRYAEPSNDTSNVLGFSDPNSDHDGVTYCYRFQELALSVNELACLDGSDDGDAAQCEIAVSLLLKTLNAHAFNFVLADVTSGIKKVTVQARALADTDVFDDAGNLAQSSARGEAFLGLGSVRIDTVRAIKNFDSGPIVELE